MKFLKNKIVRRQLRKRGLLLIDNSEDYLEAIKFYIDLFRVNSKVLGSSLGCIVFSKDRAMQLDALLRSFFLNKKGECKLSVLYKASNELHEKAYQEVFKRFGDSISIFKEGSDFKKSVINILKILDTDKLFFLVDDIIFTNSFDCDFLAKVDTSKYIFSLRLGNHLTYSYNKEDLQKLPKFINKNDEYLYWNWENGKLDWGYPMSVDGHIFGKEEISLMVNYLDFKAPNSFEGALQEIKYMFNGRLGMAYQKARMVNIPCNKVQDEMENGFGELHQDYLLELWQRGEEINIDLFQGYINGSVHEDLEFQFVIRDR